MTADEIRQSYGATATHPSFDPADPDSVRIATVEIMAEIAAQLAELNKLLKDSTIGGTLAVIKCDP